MPRYEALLSPQPVEAAPLPKCLGEMASEVLCTSTKKSIPEKSKLLFDVVMLSEAMMPREKNDAETGNLCHGDKRPAWRSGDSFGKAPVSANYNQHEF